jgi:hypothetical protein
MRSPTVGIENSGLSFVVSRKGTSTLPTAGGEASPTGATDGGKIGDESRVASAINGSSVAMSSAATGGGGTTSRDGEFAKNEIRSSSPFADAGDESSPEPSSSKKPPP